MSANPAKSNRNPSPLAATGSSPADFPLGSPQSRASARAMATERAAEPTLSADDTDALMLYRGACSLVATMTPGYQDLERTAAYRRGKELAASDVPDELSGWSKEQLKYFVAYGRVPKPGDVLHFSDLDEAENWLTSLFVEAWKRQIPQLPCPLKFDSGKLYRRVRTSSLPLYAPYGGAPVPGLLEVGDGFAWVQDRDQQRPRLVHAIVCFGENEWRPAAIRCTAPPPNLRRRQGNLPRKGDVVKALSMLPSLYLGTRAEVEGCPSVRQRAAH